MKKTLFLVTAICWCLLSNNLVSAHSGRTDGAGGHCNYSTGYYHYHSGPYAGKSFPSEDCGYEFSDNNTSKTNNTATNDSDGGSIFPVILIGGGIVAYIIYKKRKE